MQPTQKSNLVSVIIPVYNVEAYLQPCLDSVLEQTYENIEILLINDGSEDDSGRICDVYGQKDNRIKIFHRTNSGVSSARNTGIEKANGSFITFVDSDDIVSKDLIETLYSLIKNTDADIAICDPLHIFDTNPPKFSFSTEPEIIFEKEKAIAEIWYQGSFLPSAWGKLYKRSLFSEIKFKVGIIFEDMEIMHKLFNLCSRIAYTPSKLYGYVHRKESITTQKFSEKELSIFDICKELLEFAETKTKSLYKAAQAYTVVAALRIYLNAPRNGKFDNEIKQSVYTIKKHGKTVYKDQNIRRKLKIALFLFFYCRPLMGIAHSRINRWK